METAFADHLDLARCCELIAGEDLGAGVVLLGSSLVLLQRDLAALSGCLQADKPAANVCRDACSLAKSILDDL